MAVRARVLLVLLVVCAAACGRTIDDEPPVATPTVTLAHQQAPVGSPLDMKYRFVVSPDAKPFGEDYWVFVHFLDADGELMWTDDHQPRTPTTDWKPGATIEYERTMFVPKFPYAGQTLVELGLFSQRTNQRLPLNGETEGQRSYQVATFELQLQNNSQFVVFKDGWHPTEVADDEVGTEWQWSKREGTLSFRNPKRDVMFYLQLDRPVSVSTEARHVELRIGDAAVDSFSLPPDRMEMRKVPLTPAQLGTADTVELRVVVDKTFVPVTIPEMKSADARELGVRVFRTYLQAR